MCDDTRCLVSYLQTLVDDLRAKDSQKTIVDKSIDDQGKRIIQYAEFTLLKPKSKYQQELQSLHDSILSGLFFKDGQPNLYQSILKRFYTFWSILKQLLCRFSNEIKYTKLKRILKILGFQDTIEYIKIAYSIISILCRPSLSKYIDACSSLLELQTVVESNPHKQQLELAKPVTTAKVYRGIKKEILEKVQDFVAGRGDFKTNLSCAATLSALTTLKIVGLPKFKWFEISSIPVAKPENLFKKDQSTDAMKKAWKLVMEQFSDLNIVEKRKKCSDIYRSLKYDALDQKSKSTWTSILNNSVVSTGKNISVKASPGILCLTMAFFSFMYKNELFSSQAGGGPVALDLALYYSPLKSSITSNNHLVNEIINVDFVILDVFFEQIIPQTLLLCEII